MVNPTRRLEQTMRLRPTTLLLAFCFACSTSQSGDQKGPEATDEDEDDDTDLGTDSDTDEDGCLEGPEADAISVDDTCEYVPSASGNPFSVRVEWSMSHELTDPSDPSICTSPACASASPRPSPSFAAPLHAVWCPRRRRARRYAPPPPFLAALL